MNIQQTNDLLVRIQVIDNRQVGDSTVLAWHELVDDVDFDAAVEAVKMHFRESPAYLVPAHVRKNVDRILNAATFPEDEFGNPLEPDLAALQARARLAGRRQAVSS